MKTWIGFFIIIFLYVALIREEGLVYEYVNQVLDWLDAEQGNMLLVGWILPISGIIAYLAAEEISDREKERHFINVLRDVLQDKAKKTEVNATKHIQRDFEDIPVKASITFGISAYQFHVVENPDTADQRVMMEKKFTSINRLVRYIQKETEFTLDDFMSSVTE